MDKHVDALEKAIHSAQQQLALKKAEEAEADRPLKKGKAGPRGKSAKPVLLPADMAAKKEELKDRLESLKKDLGNLSLDAGEADSTLKKDASSSSQPASSSLKKETEKEKLKAFLKEEGTSTSLKKEKKRSLKSDVELVQTSLTDSKPVVVVDWHNTLEKGDSVTNRTIRSLAKLVLAAEVHILSYVGTEKMKRRTLNQIRDLIPQPVMAKVITYKTCWNQVGEGGKVDIACSLQAWSIFDDKAHIIKEAKQWGLETYPMEPGGPYKHHPPGFGDFTQAVDQWMEDHGFTVEQIQDLEKGVELMDLDT